MGATKLALSVPAGVFNTGRNMLPPDQLASAVTEAILISLLKMPKAGGARKGSRMGRQTKIMGQAVLGCYRITFRKKGGQGLMNRSNGKLLDFPTAAK